LKEVFLNQATFLSYLRQFDGNQILFSHQLREAVILKLVAGGEMLSAVMASINEPIERSQ